MTVSGVVIQSPRLLGFLFGAMTGITNDGEAGAENAWFGKEDFSLVERRGKQETRVGLFAPEVLTERFLVLRGFLFGESERLKPSRLGDGVDGRLGRYIVSSSVTGVFTLEGCKEAAGSSELGDSGDELGDGSVKEDSTVEMVVVGEESVDSVLTVVPESRRNRLEEVLF